MTAREAPDMSLDELDKRSEQQWTVWGPCSGGVRVIYFCEGRLYTYSGGDARDGDSCGIVEQTVAEYAGADPAVMDWLRSTGRLASSVLRR